MPKNYGRGGYRPSSGAPQQRDYAYSKTDDGGTRYKAFLDSMKYESMSSLVLKSDRRFIEPRPKDEGSGMPESISGHFRIRNMGEAIPEPERKKQGRLDMDKLAEDTKIRNLQRKKRKDDDTSRQEAAGILTVDDYRLEGLLYFPKSAETRDIYDKVAHVVSRYIGDETVQVLRSAVDSVIESLLKSDATAIQRRKEVEEILGKITEKNFVELVNLTRKIDDFKSVADGPQRDERDVADRLAELIGDDGTTILLDQAPAKERGIAPEEMHGYTKGLVDASAPTGKEGFKRKHFKGKKDADESAEAARQMKDDIVDTGEDNINMQTSGGADSKAWIFDADSFASRLRKSGNYTETVAERIAQDVFRTLLESDSEGQPTLDEDSLEEALLEIFDGDDTLDITADLIAYRPRIILKHRWEQHKYNPAARGRAEQDLIASGDETIVDSLWTNFWQTCGEEQRDEVGEEMIRTGHGELLQWLKEKTLPDKNGSDKLAIGSMENFRRKLERDAAENTSQEQAASNGDNKKKILKPRGLIDIESLAFEEGNHFSGAMKSTLPKGSKRVEEKNYTEIHVPPPEKKRESTKTPNIPITDMPSWAQKGFTSKSLNPIQTKCYPIAFENDDNMLVCAPTGSGKTNVAMLAMLREIGKHQDPQTGEIFLDEFKIVYIAPLKALVAEQVGNFGRRLKPFGIKVSELTGDRQLTKEQIAETQVIVTTPEKWDVITRKATDTSYTNLVRLICIDEVHLLHDDRGPVIESIVTRTLRRSANQAPVRIVALSATLPNYADVADFLHVDTDRGLFFFDNSYRPCPLRQEFIGVSQMLKPIKQVRLMDDICYKKVLDHVGQQRNQMIIFVQSRKDTARTAKYIKDKLIEEDALGQIIRPDAAVREMLQQESQSTNNADLRELLPYGFGIHHAGMTRVDRTNVEDLFNDRHIQVLVSTATLAWGVNLPAHTVIIKGTQVYSPEKGGWVQLSPQDVLQMLGRAGRPQYDTYGEGIIITSMKEVSYYLSLLNQQLPIESQLMSKLSDALNAEVVLGNVRSRDEGSDWLQNTYLYVRMLASPGLYGIGPDYDEDYQVGLPQRRVDLIHSAATALHRCNMVDYDPESGIIRKTELGTVASHYYISHHSMTTYKEQLNEGCNIIDIFRIFSMSEEFKHIPIRHDEKEELDQIINRVPIPIKEGRDEPLAKINLLLQTYITRLKLEGFALVADMVYITQSAGRLLRALFEICLRRGWAGPTEATLALCQMAEHRMWSTQSPLRQFPKLRKEIVSRVEGISVRWNDYFQYKDDLPRLGELLGDHKIAREIAPWIGRFPRVEVHAQAQPITRTQLLVTLQITPIFGWLDDVHGTAQLFWIFIEDDEGRKVLFHDKLLIRKEFADGEQSTHFVNCMVYLETPLPPCYFISVISDRWLGSITRHGLMLNTVVVPERFDRPTQFKKNLAPKTISDLKEEHRYLYPNIKKFNILQSQCFPALYESDDNVFVGASNVGARVTSAELAILRHWSSEATEDTLAVYIAPFQELVDIRLKDWARRFSDEDGLEKSVAKLTGDVAQDLRLLSGNDLVLATPIQWDFVSRQWRRRQNIQDMGLFIADEVHMLGSQNGHVYETIITRMMTMRDQLEDRIAERKYDLRLVGLSVPVANSADLGGFLGVEDKIFNFEPRLRSVPLMLDIQQFNIPHFPSFMIGMVKPAYNAILEMSPATPVVIFVPSRKYARSTAAELLGLCESAGNPDRFLPETDNDYSAVYEKINESGLHVAATHGIGYYHKALDKTDKSIVQRLFHAGALQVLVVTRDCCWELQADAHLVIVMGTQYYEGKEHRYVDYSVADILQMLNKATKYDPAEEDKRVRGVVMLPPSKANYYKKFLTEPFPVESQLYTNIVDSYIPDIASRNFETTQDVLNWLTFSFLYRRVQSNPSYYGISSDSDHDKERWLENDVVEETLAEMVAAKIVEYEQDEITPLPPVQIAAHHNVTFVTIQTMLMSLSGKSNHRSILEVVCAATELADVPMRRHEEGILQQIYDFYRPRPAKADFKTPETKAFMLLSAHFHRYELDPDLEDDQAFVVKKAYDLLGVAADVLSSEAHLNAQRAIEIMQFVVQGMFDDDSVLKQIPGFDDKQVKVANKFGIEDVEGFIDAMIPDENPNYEKLIKELGFDNKQLQLAADFANDYWPSIGMSFSMDGKEGEALPAGEHNVLSVEIQRDNFDEDQHVHAPLFPVTEKQETWYVLVGDAGSNKMFGIKRVTLRGEATKIQLPFLIEEPGDYDLVVVLMSGDYVGTDLEKSFSVSVVEQMDVEEDEEEDSDEMEVDE